MTTGRALVAGRPSSFSWVDTGAVVLAVVPVALTTAARVIFCRLFQRRGRRTGTVLLALEGDYSLRTIRARRLEQGILYTDLEGFFDHVWTVHPAVGADPQDPPTIGPPSRVDLAPRHSVIEGTVGRFRCLEQFPMLNFLLAQGTLFAYLSRLIQKERIGAVRANDPLYFGLFGFLLARANGVLLVLRLIANYDGEPYCFGYPASPRLLRSVRIERKIARFLLRRAELVAAGNADILGYAVKNGASGDRSTVFRVGPAVDPVHFEEPPEERQSIRDEIGIDERPFLICVGRLVWDKYPEDVVRVLSIARQLRPDLAAVFVGDGPERGDLERLASELGVRSDVVFAGDRDQQWIARALTSADVVLSPITGRALVEGALSGTALVAYDVDWHSELIRPGVTGMLVAHRDCQAMASAVCRILADPHWAAEMANNARAETLSLMDRRTLIEHERSEYAKLLNGARRSGVAAPQGRTLGGPSAPDRTPSQG